MATRKKTARRRRASRGTVARRGARATRPARQQPGQGPNLKRLLAADVLTLRGARSLSDTSIDQIEKLSRTQVNTLIDVRRRVGRKPNCWLI